MALPPPQVSEELRGEIPSWLRRRAVSYARAPIVRRPAQRSRFARFASVQPGDHVLDVGTGPGYSAFVFARKAAHVSGVDWRPELLDLAGSEAVRRRLLNLTLVEASPTTLPFPDDSFDLVASAGALHHFVSPQKAVAEIMRVCRPAGRIALEDVVTSEQDVRARYHNRLERLRDRSHQRILRLSEVAAILGQIGLGIRRIEVQESVREFSEWVGVTRPPAGRSERIRHLLQRSVEQDLSGLNVQPEDDTFLFTQQVAWVLAVKEE